MFAEKIPSQEGMPSGSDQNRMFSDQTPSPSTPLALLPHATFAARFCVHRGISFEEFEEVVFESTLYPAARQLRNLLSLKRNYFAPDRQFIECVGRTSNMKELEAVVMDFSDSRNNDGLLRGTFKLRISARKLRRIARQYLQHRRADDPPLDPPAGTFDVLPDAASSRSPFAGGSSVPFESAPQNPGLSASPAKDRRVATAELAAMQEEIARLTEQREVLKKTVGIFCEKPSPLQQ